MRASLPDGPPGPLWRNAIAPHSFPAGHSLLSLNLDPPEASVFLSRAGPSSRAQPSPGRRRGAAASFCPPALVSFQSAAAPPLGWRGSGITSRILVSASERRNGGRRRTRTDGAEVSRSSPARTVPWQMQAVVPPPGDTRRTGWALLLRAPVWPLPRLCSASCGANLLCVLLHILL